MDVCVALSQPGPDVIQKEWITKMAKDAIVFVCANPIPEMWPWDAKEAGAAIVATGRSDFANQVNNSLGFPGIFRGTLDVRASTITDEMCIAAAVEMAKLAEENGLSEDYIMPTMDEVDVFPREAAAVAMKAIEQGVARFADATFESEYENARAIITRARGMVQDAMATGYIAMPQGSKPPRPTKMAMKVAARVEIKSKRKTPGKAKATKTIRKLARKSGKRSAQSAKSGGRHV
jgi:malate dehydrogenase (oxaloacetate-decarboxylating)